MARHFAVFCYTLLVAAVVCGGPADGPASVPPFDRLPAQGAAEYLVAAMQELHGGANLGFSSKADFISPDDHIDAGVVQEGPQTGIADDLDGAMASSALGRAEDHGYEHSRHAQLIRTQHKPTHEQQQPAYGQQQPSYGHQQPSYGQQQPSYGQQQQPSYGQQQPSHGQQPTTEYARPSPVYRGKPETQYQEHPPAGYLPEQPPSDYLPQEPDAHEDSVPPLSKEELAALFEAALQKGSQLDLANLPGSVEALGEPSVGAMPGYYYYYYPIKQFPKKEEGAAGGGDGQNGGDGNGDGNAMDNNGGKQMVEPLFVAVAAFMGVSIIFMFSMIFLPKFGFFRSDGIGLISKFAPDDLSSLTRVVLESVDGRDCDQRIACELGRVLRKLRMHDRPLRILEVMLSKPAQKQIQEVRRAAIFRTKCNAIRCKRKS